MLRDDHSGFADPQWRRTLGRSARLAPVPIALLILLATLQEYAQVRIWFEDSYVYHEEAQSYDLTALGRWLNYLLFPVLKTLNGQAALFLNLSCLFAFAFIAARRYVGDSAYALAFAALCIQAPNLTHQLTWPLATLPATAILAVAAFTVRALPIYAFYALFGVLLVGTFQYFYYLLPLLHLPLLASSGLRAGFRSLTTRIVPAWVLGFLVGNLWMLAVVYAATLLGLGTGQIGLPLEEWRDPRPVHGLDDLMGNVAKAVAGMQIALDRLLLSIRWLPELARVLLPYGVAIAWIALAVSGRCRHLPAKLLFAGVAVAEFAATIPLGITLSFRAVTPLALGAAALLVLAPWISGGGGGGNTGCKPCCCWGCPWHGACRASRP